MAKKSISLNEPFESNQEKGRFAKICYDMMESKAWDSLNLRQRGLYLQFKKHLVVKKINGKILSTNQNEIYFPVGEQKKHYPNLTTYRKDLDTLIEFGFIKCIASGYTTREKSIYGFSDNWKLVGIEGFEVPIKDKRPTTMKKNQIKEKKND